MKKINENETVTVVMDNETLEAMVEDNISIVPKNQRKKFDTLTLEQKAKKIQFYMDMEQINADARIKNSILNRVKELFDKRHATIDDAREVIKFAQEFVDNFRQHQIEEIDRQLEKIMKGNNMDYGNLDDKQIYTIIHDDVETINIYKDNESRGGKYLEIIFKDTTIYKYHLLKYGNYDRIYIIDNNKETRLEDIIIKKRFLRK